MSKQWYYVGADDTNVGPVKAAVIRERVADGTILPETMIWREGLDVWVQAAQIRKLWTAATVRKKKNRRKTSRVKKPVQVSATSPNFDFLDVDDPVCEREEGRESAAVHETISDATTSTVADSAKITATARRVKHPLTLRRSRP